MLADMTPLDRSSLPHVTTPTSLVIFGATGALANRKLYPALMKLQQQDLLPEQFRIIGISPKQLSAAAYQAVIKDACAAVSQPDAEAATQRLLDCALHLSGDLGQPTWAADLQTVLADIEPNLSEHRVIYYLAVPPSLFAATIIALGGSGLLHGNQQRRSSIVVEKPFGHDLASARELNQLLAKQVPEDAVYRMDHYLGKDTVQNILAFRFENGLFEPSWNRQHIDHIQITQAEVAGVGERGAFYEETGALRDVVQNHLLQLLAHVAMEPPADLSADVLRSARANVLSQVRPLTADELSRQVVRGQYGAGQLALRGDDVPAYRDESAVAADSVTETFVAVPVTVESERWRGVPFYLRSGKRLAKDVTEINIQFKASAHQLHARGEADVVNLLTLRIQPNEGIALRLAIKKPGYQPQLEEVDMSFCYRDLFYDSLPEAYDRLLLDCLTGDQTLFTRADEVEASWRFIDPILQHWRAHQPPSFPNYSAGSAGPPAADDLLAATGRQWWSDRLDVCPIPGTGQAITHDISVTNQED